MKKLFYTLFCLFYSLSGNTQIEGLVIEKSSALGDQINHIMAPLDLSLITTNVFYDKGMDFFNWRKLDGNFPSDSTIVKSEHWGLLNFQAVSSFMGNYYPFPPPETYLSYMQNHNVTGPIYLGLMAIDYQRFRDDAITANLIYFDAKDSTLNDVQNRSDSPYLRDTMLSLVALRYTTEGKDLEFILPEDIVMSNIGVPDSMWIDFDDGNGYTLIDTNQIINMSYSDYGVHTLVFKCKINNGDLFYAKTQIENIPQTSGLSVQMPPGYDNEPNETHILNRDTINIFFGNPCKKLLKPIIFIEGINPSKLFRNYWLDMKFRLRFDKDNVVQIVQTPDSKSAWDNLAKMGYDIIYYNFELGEGDILENSSRVSKFITWVNEEKRKNKSNEKNIVIGASMGGVVGYHALRTMEVSNSDPDTKFLITFDSPLKGANVPLGLQCMVKYLGNYTDPNIFNPKKINEHVPILKTFEDILISGAAKQMLYYNIYSCDSLYEDRDGDGIDELYITNCGNTKWHNSFYDALDNMGPLVLEHIPISNGSSIGEKQKLLASEHYIHITAKSQTDDFLGAVTVNTCDGYILPSSGIETIYYHDIEKYFQIIIGGYWPRERLTIKADASKFKNYDIAPGGMTDFGISDGLNQLTFGNSSAKIKSSQSAWGFVPTVSGLNMPMGTDPFITINDCGTNLTERCYSSKDDVAICAYSKTNQHNQGHVSFNSKNATFILDVLY
ncbi:MAG TPA: hypothetical protein PLD02_13615, partial [Saprospiraceae bacterium]|nr:hypothetical protein [Saprospiraceae bacterium]